MVQAAQTKPQLDAEASRAASHAAPELLDLPHRGRASPGYTVALAVSGPLLMMASFVLCGLLVAGAQGATGYMWLGGAAMFGAMATVFATALAVAESSTD